ncbi:MAG: hypothetical protein ACRDF5_01295 [bacterium]
MKRPIPVLVMAVLIGLALPAGLGGPAFGQEYGSPDRPEPPAGQSLLISLQALLDNLFDCGFGFGLGEGGLAISPSGDRLLAASLTPPAVAQSTQTKIPLLRYWDTGQPASQADRSRGLPVSNLTISVSPGGGFAVGFRAAALPPDPSPYPYQYRLAFDLPDRRGATNAFAGAGFEEDLIISVRADAPGRFSVLAAVGGTERQIEATVEHTADRVIVRLPLRTVLQVGLAAPGMRVIVGTVGPAPTRIFHRIPERGAIRLGLPGQPEIDAAGVSRMARARFDLNGDRRDDLYYLDTNGNGGIDAVAYDRNGDGRISFVRLEGPHALLGPDGNAYEFPSVERSATGRQQRFIARIAQVAYVLLVEDRNGDGDVADAAEFEGRFAELQ